MSFMNWVLSRNIVDIVGVRVAFCDSESESGFSISNGENGPQAQKGSSQ